ncbi:probable WRKY transcription factor 62 [Vicia villosa]|uniref:probable WRKY transcription factor 62 n=1 Tax=Vicia villosa TaxID=3911 RepID=UPI00273B03C6|nr:probable WRKY transcription factor 62 [Vicia villosa]
MENLVWLSTNGKKAMEEELLKGRDMANQLLEVLTYDDDDDKSNVIKEVKGSNSKSLSTLIAEDLVREVLKSLTNTLLLLNNNQDSNDVPGRDILDGAYKKLKILDTKHPKGSNKRKSISASWEKTSSILIDDGYTWRKYGQKKIRNGKYYRSYYRCTHMSDQHCEAMKHVQRTQENPPLYKTTYYAHHTCKSSLHSELIFSSDDSSGLLSFDNNILIKQEYQLPAPLPLPPIHASIKEDPMKEIHADYFDQNQFLLPENILSCNFEVYFDYLKHTTMLLSTESFEIEKVYDQFGF